MVPLVSGPQPIRGDLQQEIMDVLWRSTRVSVEEVRQALPAKRRGAYTTVQTVLNRLSEGRLVKRHRAGRAILYSARVSEAEYAARSLHLSLAGVSEAARLSALASLVEELSPSEMEAVGALAAEIQARRKS